MLFRFLTIKAIATYTSRACEKLRAQASICDHISVWIETNRFKTDNPQYSNIISCSMPEPTAYTPILIKYALHLLKRIYRDGYGYKKAGVALMGIVPENEIQLSLYTNYDHGRTQSLMTAVDRINAKWGRETVRSGASGYLRPWSMKRAKLSPRYTTNWDEILRA